MHILALHGFTGRGSDFAPFAEFVGGDWHCPDLPGHGPNPQLDCTPEATIDFVEAERATRHSRHSMFSVQRSAFNVQGSSVLLGYSMGARAALQHALAYPGAWDALVLISPNPGIADPAARAARRATDAELAERIERGGVDAFIEFWQQTPMIRSQRNIRAEWRSAMQAARAGHTAEGLAASLRRFGQGSCPDLWPELPPTMPTLLITGEQDIKYTRIAERMSAKHVSHTVIGGVGHAPHLEAPGMTAEVIHSFLPSH